MPEISNMSDQRAARGEVTRKRLLKAGLRLFGMKGYDAVSTRELAKEAGVNPGAIAFHYQGKKGLYEAVLNMVIARMRSLTIPVAESLNRNISNGRADIQHIAPLINHMMDLLLHAHGREENADHVAMMVQRELSNPTSAFERLFVEAFKPCMEALIRLAEIAGYRRSEVSTQIMACSLASLPLSIVRDRAIVQRATGQAHSGQYSKEDLDAVRRMFARAALAMLGYPVPAVWDRI